MPANALPIRRYCQTHRRDGTTTRALLDMQDGPKPVIWVSAHPQARDYDMRLAHHLGIIHLSEPSTRLYWSDGIRWAVPEDFIRVKFRLAAEAKAIFIDHAAMCSPDEYAMLLEVAYAIRARAPKAETISHG